MIKLILVRHALTEDNQQGRLSGHIDSKISENGKLQIKGLTNYLKDVDIDKIYTTTSQRTKETIREISIIKDIQIIEKESLKEIHFGDFEGMNFTEIKENFPDEFSKMIKEGYSYKYPNGESLIDTYFRVAKEIDDIILNNQDKTILVCSHGGTIRNIIAYLVTNSYEYHWNFRIDNASITILEIDNKFAVINTLNNTNFN